MTGETNNNVQGFLRGVENAANRSGSEMGDLRALLSDMSAVDERLKATLQRMEETETQIGAALELLQQLNGAGQGASAPGFDAGANGNQRNDRQWQSSLARIILSSSEVEE